MQSTYEDARYILSELNIGILKIPDLTAGNIQGGPAKAIQNRVNNFNNTKSNYRVAALDKNEDFTFVNRTVAGVSELMEQFKTGIVGASEMPNLILFGESPSGMNGETDGEMSTYYDNIEDIRQDQIAPCIETILKADGYEGAEWSFESLWEMSDKDKSLVMQQSSAAIMPLVGSLLSPEEAMAQLNSLSVWNIDDSDDLPDFLGVKDE
jgi:phage-related protein (TIGR01555 family)